MRKVDKEKKEQNEIKKKQIKKTNEIVIGVSKAVQQLVEKEKANLPQYLQERKELLLKQLLARDIAIDNGDESLIGIDSKFLYQDIVDSMFKPIISFREKPAQYSPQELYVIYEVFSEMCINIRKSYYEFTPSLDLFLTFSDIGLNVFRKWQGQEEYRPTCDKIYAFIGAFISDAGMKRTVDNKMAMFLQERDFNKQLTPSITVVGSQFNTVSSEDVFKKYQDELKERSKTDL